MTSLTDTQLVVLSAAAQRPDRRVLPLPDHIKGGAAHKVVHALITRGLVEEVDARPGDQVWRETGDRHGHGVTLVATAAALDALGIESADKQDETVEYHFNAGTNSAGEPAAHAPTAADAAPVEPTPKKRGRTKKAATTARDAAAPRKARDGSKQAQLIAMLERPEGATIAQIVEATNWQPHTVRGVIAGALKKKLGLTVTSEKIEGERTYRIAH